MLKMVVMIKYLAVIPARGGSKRITKKNLRIICGKPLILWTLEAAKKSFHELDIVVSTDDTKIFEFVKSCGFKVTMRPEDLATDKTKSEAVVEHVLNEQLALGLKYETLILLQPTSPLRTSIHIDAALNSFESDGCKSIISVVSKKSDVLKYFVVSKTGSLTGIHNDLFPFMPSQSLPEVCCPNGAIYICDVNEFRKKQSLFVAPVKAFFMSDNDSIDIDTMKDLRRARHRLKPAKYNK